MLIAQVLKRLGIFDVNIVLNNRIFNSMGIAGDILQLILIIDAIALLALLVAGIPLYLVMRDVRGVLQRFQLISAGGEDAFDPDSNAPYLQGRARSSRNGPMPPSISSATRMPPSCKRKTGASSSTQEAG